MNVCRYLEYYLKMYVCVRMMMRVRVCVRVRVY